MRGIHLCLIGAMLVAANTATAAEEHCLVTQAMALAGYDARMRLLIGTDDIFDSVYRTHEAATKKVLDKYRELFAARDKRGNEENPENHMGAFNSPTERDEYFRRWGTDIKALEAGQSGELAVYSEAFDKAIAADPNQATHRRVARINALWKKEFYAPCYWGAPK